MGSGQSESSAHEPKPAHDASHAHESEHLIRRRHEPVPLQVTSQGPLPHRISSPQLDAPMHSTSQDVALPQMMRCTQEFSPQTTRHGMSDGHSTSDALQLPCALQSTTQTPAGSQVPFVQPSSHSAICDESIDPSGVPPPLQRSWPGVAHQPSLQC